MYACLHALSSIDMFKELWCPASEEWKLAKMGHLDIWQNMEVDKFFGIVIYLLEYCIESSPDKMGVF